MMNSCTSSGVPRTTQMYTRASCRSTGTWAYCTSATAAAITMAKAKDSTVSGMVTARPGTRMRGNESIST